MFPVLPAAVRPDLLLLPLKTRSSIPGVKSARDKLPARSKVSTRIVIFHITMVMYIHVYNTVSFSADTVINTTCKPIVESRPGQKKTFSN